MVLPPGIHVLFLRFWGWILGPHACLASHVPLSYTPSRSCFSLVLVYWTYLPCLVQPLRYWTCGSRLGDQTVVASSSLIINSEVSLAIMSVEKNHMKTKQRPSSNSDTVSVSCPISTCCCLSSGFRWLPSVTLTGSSWLILRIIQLSSSHFLDLQELWHNEC